MKLENLKGSDFLERVLIDPAIDECGSTKQGIVVEIRGPVVQAAQNTLPLYRFLANIAKLTSNYKGSYWWIVGEVQTATLGGKYQTNRLTLPRNMS